MDPIDGLRELAGPALAASGLELWDLELEQDVVRVLVDRDGGVDLEALGTASSVLSPLLDEHPELSPSGRYQLEVSSPGLERTLRTPAQYQRFVGTAVTVKTSVAVGGSRRLRGVLTHADDRGIALAVEDAPDGDPPLDVTYDQIQRTRTVLAWGPTPKLGGARPKGSAPRAAANTKDADA